MAGAPLHPTWIYVIDLPQSLDHWLSPQRVLCPNITLDSQIEHPSGLFYSVTF